jgi:hypothetical protein
LELINNIRLKLGEYYLKRDVAAVSRNKASLNFNMATNIGILFDATDKDDFERVKLYIKYLKECRKKVKSIGYYDAKEVPPLQYSKLEYDYICKKNLNLALKPSDDFIDNFIAEEFDILLHIGIKDHFPLKYIAAMSRAKFKIGKYTKDNEKYFDLMLNIDADQSLQYFLKQLDHYMGLINKNA